MIIESSSYLGILNHAFMAALAAIYSSPDSSVETSR